MVDPITLEVIQNRLTEIAYEAGIAMIRTAASPIVVEVKDLGFNIADHLGRTVVYSMWMPRHGTTLAYMFRSSLQKFGEEGIHPGDMILVNNPYDGALHLLDLAVIAPVYYKGQRIAWTGCATHHADIRAMRPGLCTDATDWSQEGIVFRPIKLVEGGKLRQDLFDFVLDNVRVPLYTGLDLKSQIAANNVAHQKIVEMVERYGVEVLKESYDEILDFSERKAKERVKLVPEGRYAAVDYIDYDKLHTLRCALIVKEGRLIFDFEGTDPQAGSFINSALACTVANVHNIVMCQLFPDIVPNEGSLRVVEVKVPEGSVLNCKPPAPCSGASTVGGWKAQCLAIKVLSLALEKSELWWRMNADWGSSCIHSQISGIDRQGRNFQAVDAGGVMQGGGARATKDGLDVANIAGSTNTCIPNIETLEGRYPLLYLSRGIKQDSGGEGRYRGGLAGEFVVTPYGVERAEAAVGYIGKDIAPSGCVGALPGGKALVMLKRNSNVKELLKRKVPSFNEIEGETEKLPQKNAPIPLSDQDVLYVLCQGGGGFGDPLERDPALVQRDVEEGYLSLEKAQKVYKVALSPRSYRLGWKETERLRR